jgi:hypothetical protein
MLLVGEWMDHDDFEEIRALTGLTVRFQEELSAEVPATAVMNIPPLQFRTQT